MTSPSKTSLDAIVEMLRASDTNFSKFAGEQREANSRTDASLSEFSVFAEEQRAAIKNINVALAELPKIVEKLESNSKRIVELENQNQSLTQQVTTLKAQQAKQDKASRELLLNGFPTGTQDEPRVLVEKIFDVLGVTFLSSHIVRVSPFLKKQPGTNINSNRDNNPKFLSLLVTLSSSAIRDEVIIAKRAKKDLFIHEIIGGTDTRGKIFVNEFLNRETHILLQDVRKRAKEIGINRVWTHDSTIYVRKDAGHPRHEIQSAEDLAKLS